MFAAFASEPWFGGDDLPLPTIGGAAGGAIFGAMCACFSSSRVAVVLVAIPGAIAGCIVALIAGFLYAGIAWPAPQPYPGAEPVINSRVGSGAVSHAQVYTITVAVDDMQAYYQSEMHHYCVSDWQFDSAPDCTDCLSCRRASCEIRRFWMEQYFCVTLCSLSPSLTKVSQVDTVEH
jgi:hypothetical protein